MKTKQEIELEIESARKELKYCRNEWDNNYTIGADSILLADIQYYEYKIKWLKWVINN